MFGSYIDYIKSAEITEEEWKTLLSKSSVEFINDVFNSIKCKNRFFDNDLILKLLFQYSSNVFTSFIVNKSLSIDTILYRARRYVETDLKEKLKLSDDTVFKGYDLNGSFISPKPCEGRCNPKNIPYLYVSDNIETCIYEVTPNPNEYVSVAEIKILESLKIFNMDITVSAAYDPNNKKDKFINSFILSLGNFFSQSATDSEKDIYLLCQYISEFIRFLGYDGICFRTSKEDTFGLNYTIFNYNKAKPISSKLYVNNKGKEE